jgi:predicted transcriptional regulator
MKPQHREPYQSVLDTVGPSPPDRLAPMLTRENPATLVQQDGKLIGIVSRYDLLQQLIGTRG